MANSQRSLFQRILGFFRSDASKAKGSGSTPAQFWPETQQFIDTLHDIVEKRTQNDASKRRMNDQILSHLVSQIESKGHHGTDLEKAQALEIIADRVLTNTMGKFVGLDQTEDGTMAFSKAVLDFKLELQKRVNG